jgi:hypothetical protein
MNIEQQDDQLISIESHRITLILTVIFNLFDAGLTLTWVLAGHAIEANPLMASALDLGPIAFMFAKIAVVNLGLTMLWLQKKKIWVRYAALGILGLYSYVMMIHSFFIADLILRHV